MDCPLCQSGSTFAFSAKGFPLNDCTRCGHRFAAIAAGEAHVRDVYDDAFFNGGGAGYPDYLREAALLEQRGVTYAKRIRSVTAKTGKLLDVGAAAGFLLRGFQSEGWQGVGLEPNAEMARYGREQLGLDNRQGTLETLETDETFDLVSMIQVVAHFYDPRTAFAKARALLNDGGLLLVETWNRDAVSARLLGRHWHEYSPPSTLHFFSEQGLSDTLTTLGFEKVAGRRTMKKISGAHVKSLLKYRLGDLSLLNAIPDHLNIPYLSDDLFWALYKKK